MKRAGFSEIGLPEIQDITPQNEKAPFHNGRVREPMLVGMFPVTDCLLMR